MLLSYEKYIEMGGELPEKDFSLYEALSEAELISIANGALPDAPVVESCMVLLIDAYEKADKSFSSSKATQFSNDGVQVTMTSEETSESIMALARDRIKMLFASAGIHKFLGVKHYG